jgi:hypothetical protein
MNDITYAGFDYNRPLRGFMDDFRIYNVPLQLRELRQLAQVPPKPGARLYTLRPMTTAAPVNGNVSVYMDSSASRVYLSAGVGNLYIGNIATSTWTQSTLAAGSSGQLENRNWRDIVCDGTGQYVVACVQSPTLQDPSGVVFYSSDYGNTFTMTNNSQIATSCCFNLAMSADGNITYLTAWGQLTPTPPNSIPTTGNTFRSMDKGITWTTLTANNTNNANQVRCNSTGEFITLGGFGQNMSNILGNYGNTLLNSPGGQFGYINTNPVIFTSGSTEYVGLLGMNRNGYTTTVKQSIRRFSPFTSTVVNCQRTPSPLNPQTWSYYPWTGSRNIAMSSDTKYVLATDTAGLGNVFLSVNGIETVSWFGTAANGEPNFTNLTITSRVPRSAWSGLSVTYNDNFVFANKTGTVYTYSWTLQ